MMCCCLLDSKASVMVLPRRLVTWLGPHEAGPWTWGTHGHRPTTSLVNTKQKLLRSQSFFQHTSPRPTNFNVVWPKLLYNEPLHLQDLAFNIEIGGRGTVCCLAQLESKRTRSVILGIGHALAKFQRWEPGLL